MPKGQSGQENAAISAIPPFLLAPLGHGKSRLAFYFRRARIFSVLAAIIFVSLAGLFGLGCTGPGGGATPEDLDAAEDDPKELAADFTVNLYQGEDELGLASLNLSELRGRPVVLNFWAGLCPPCRAELPEFQEFHDEFEGRVTLVGVDLGQFLSLGSQEDALKLLDELGVTFPAGYTEDGQVVRDYRVLGLPSTVFIDANGEIYRKWDGVLNRESLTEIAQEMLVEGGT